MNPIIGTIIPHNVIKLGAIVFGRLLTTNSHQGLKIRSIGVQSLVEYLYVLIFSSYSFVNFTAIFEFLL